MATRAQKAAARKNIKKAQAALRRKRGGKRRSKRRATKKRRRKAIAAAIAAPKRRRRRRKAAAKRRRRAAPRRRRTARRRTARRGTQRSMSMGRIRVVKVPQTKTIVVAEKRATRRKKSRRRRRAALQENPIQLGRLGTSAGDGGDYLGLMQENPLFGTGAVMAWGTVAVGFGIGLAAADMLDRFVATRKPDNGQHPWYGGAAAAAQHRRPDAMRMGAQAIGGLGALGGAYMLRGVRFAPWLLGGTAIGMGANFVKQLINWYLMPAIFKADSPTEASFATRMYPIEQSSVQDTAEAFFDNWSASQALSLNQGATPVVQNPVADPTHAYVLAGAARPGLQGVGLGKGQTAGDKQDNLGAAQIVPTGRIGMCAACKGMNGCYSGCPELSLCGECGDGLVAQRCLYTVQDGDDLVMMASVAGIDVSQINELNEGTPNDYWVTGNKVTLPYAFCRYMEAQPPPIAAAPMGVPSVRNVVPAATIPTRDPRFSIEDIPFGTAPPPIQDSYPTVSGGNGGNGNQQRTSLFGIGTRED